MDFNKLKEDFKKAHNDIILENDLVLYNNNYLNILISKNITVELDCNATTNKIEKIINASCSNIKSCGLSQYDIEKINLSDSYIKTLAFFSKHQSILLSKINNISVYNKKFINLLEIKYLLKKYNLTDKDTTICFINPRIKNIDIVNKNISNYNIINTFSDLNDIDKILQKNCVFNISGKFSNYTLDSNFKSFMILYNAIIKLEPINRTFTIKVYPLFLTTLTFQVIDVLKSYFQNSYLIKPKYTFPITFQLVLINKNKVFDEDHKLSIDDEVASISNTPISTIYTDFFNALVDKVNNNMHIYFSLKALKQRDPGSYNLFIKQLSYYRECYAQNKKLVK